MAEKRLAVSAQGKVVYLRRHRTGTGRDDAELGTMAEASVRHQGGALRA